MPKEQPIWADYQPNELRVGDIFQLASKADVFARIIRITPIQKLNSTWLKIVTTHGDINMPETGGDLVRAQRNSPNRRARHTLADQ